ncbi:MAG: AsmA family protein [Burkholderiales bacterium]
MTIGSLVLLLVAFVGYVAFVGITVDAAPMRGRLAEAFSSALGRAVRFEGPAELEISGSPWLRVGGLRVADPAGFDHGTLASLGEVRLAVDLWALLRQRVHIRELSGRDVKVRLWQRPDGTNNWTFALAKSDPKPTTAAPSDGGAAARDAALMLDVRKVSLAGLDVEYVSAAGRSHWFALETLAGTAPQGSPVRLTMQGKVEKSFPYGVHFEGGALSDAVALDKPWPFELRVDFLSTTLNLMGSTAGTRCDVDFAIGTENLTELERLLQSSFPKVGATALAGHVRYTPGFVDVSGLTGVMGRTAMQGNVAFDSRGSRPKLAGELTLPVFDPRPFLTDKPADAEPPKSLRDTYRDLAKATFSLSALKTSDVDLKLAVDRVLNVPGDPHDVSLTVRIDDGRLDAPLHAVMADVALDGRVRADGGADPPQFALSLGTRDSDLGGLAELLAGARGIKGRLGRFELALKAAGDQGSELVQSLDVRLDIERGKFTYGNQVGERPVDFVLDRFALVLPAGKPLAGQARGSLIGQPVRLSLAGGTLERVMLDERTPLDFTVQSGSVRAHLEGILQAPGPTTGPQIAFDLAADRTSDVASWLGLKPGASARVTLKGRASATDTDWRLDELAFRLGRSEIIASLARRVTGGQPRLGLKLHAARVDVQELQSLLPKPAERPRTDNTPNRPVLQIPILPKGIDLGDADIEIRVERVDGTPLAPRAIAFDGRIRDGAMEPSVFSATIADILFRGAVSLDLRGALPASTLWLAAQDVDIGRLLKRFGLATNIDATVGSMRLALNARASLLGEMLQRSDLVGNLDNGAVTIRDANTGAAARFALQTGTLTASAGAPIRLDLEGSADDTPVQVSLETAKATDLVRPDGRIPFRLSAAAADVRLRLSGGIDKPVGQGDVALDMSVSGERFDKLNRLARASLPPWGPYSAAGRFRMSKQGYAVDDLVLTVGASTLKGKGSLDTARAKPRIDIALDAPSIQLDDFKFGEWSPVEKKADTPAPAQSGSLKDKAAKASDDAQKLLSPATLKRQDASLVVKRRAGVAGPGHAGQRTPRGAPSNGCADIGPARGPNSGRFARLWLGYNRRSPSPADTRMEVDRFDYGSRLLAAGLGDGPEGQVQPAARCAVPGLLPVRDVSEAHGNGRIDFAVVAEDTKSGPRGHVGRPCSWRSCRPSTRTPRASTARVGAFALNDGIFATDKTIVMDTSRMGDAAR